MSVDVSWPRTSPVSPEEKLLRNIFKYIGVSEDKADNAALRSMVERYKQEAETRN